MVHDPGLPVELSSKAPVPLRDRYVLPDAYEDRIDSRALSAEPPQFATSKAPPGQSPNWPNASVQQTSQTTDPPRQRRQLNDWLSDQARQVLLGGPGLGKSALLRYVTLDLLSQNPVLTQASSFHDTYLPIWLSFPFWTAKVDQSTAALSIPDIIQVWFTSGARIDCGHCSKRHSTMSVYSSWLTVLMNIEVKTPRATPSLN